METQKRVSTLGRCFRKVKSPIWGIRGVIEVWKPGWDDLGKGGGQELKRKLAKLEPTNSYQPCCKAPWPLYTTCVSKAK